MLVGEGRQTSQSRKLFYKKQKAVKRAETAEI
jgi:hypothetical protein